MHSTAPPFPALHLQKGCRRTVGKAQESAQQKASLKGYHGKQKELFSNHRTFRGSLSKAA